MQINIIYLSLSVFPDNCVFYLFNFLIFIKDGDKQDASSSKAKSKVKSVDLPILANTTRQLDQDVLNNFVDYEVSHNSLSVCLSSLENMWSVAINWTQLSSKQPSFSTQCIFDSHLKLEPHFLHFRLNSFCFVCTHYICLLVATVYNTCQLNQLCLVLCMLLNSYEGFSVCPKYPWQSSIQTSGKIH